MRFIDRKQIREQTGREPRAQSVLELSATMFFLLVFTLVSLELGLSLYGAAINDRACRDAARAAADAPDELTAAERADAILLAHLCTTGLFGGPTRVGAIVYQDFAGAPPPATSPYVTVSTQTKVTLPLSVVNFINATFNASGNVTFVQTYTFPIVQTK